MKTDKEMKILSRIEEAKRETESTFSIFFDKSADAFKFYLGDQWTDSDKEKAEKAGIVPLNINMVRKQVDSICGQQRQNKNEVLVRPTENGDVLTADILSKLVAWVQNSSKYDYVLPEAFKDACIAGVGWINVYPCFNKDPENGDIVFKHVPLFEMKVDPHTRERDISDARYILRQRNIHKATLKQMYPDKANDIDALTGIDGEQYSQESYISADRGEHVEVVEYWEKEIVKKEMFLFSSGMMSPVQNFKPEEVDMFQESYEIVKKDYEVVTMSISAGSTILYYAENPYGNNIFPYIPVWGFFTPSFYDWSYKVHGIVRPLMDPQREKNVRRTQYVEIAKRAIASGYIYEEGAIDPNEWAAAPKVGALLKKKPGREIVPIVPPPAPDWMLTIEQLSTSDFNVVGLGGDFLGQVEERGASGVTQRQRQRQSLVSIEELFDNLSMANKISGKHIVLLISQNFSVEKIKRILGSDTPFNTKNLEDQAKKIQLDMQPSPVMMAQLAGMTKSFTETGDEQVGGQIAMAQQQFQNMQMQAQQALGQIANEMQRIQDEERNFWSSFSLFDVSMKYDMVLDEIRNNPTQRAAALEALTEAAHYGISIPPEVIVSLLDIPNDIRQTILANIQAQQQAAAEQQKIENEMRMADAAAKMASAQYKSRRMDTENMKIQNEMSKRVDGQGQG